MFYITLLFQHSCILVLGSNVTGHVLALVWKILITGNKMVFLITWRSSSEISFKSNANVPFFQFQINSKTGTFSPVKNSLKWCSYSQKFNFTLLRRFFVFYINLFSLTTKNNSNIIPLKLNSLFLNCSGTFCKWNSNEAPKRY